MLGHHWGWGSRPGGREPVGEAALGCVMSSLYSHVQHSSVSHHPAWLAPKCPGFIF